MKHIRTFDEAVNEGIISTVKKWLFPTIYRVSYNVTHYKVKSKSKEDAEKMKTMNRHWDVKADTQEIAEDKFWAEANRQLKGIEPRPKVEIISIHETKKLEHKKIKIV